MPPLKLPPPSVYTKRPFFCLCILIFSGEYACYSDKEGNPMFPLMLPIAYLEKRWMENQRTQRKKEMRERILTGVKTMPVQTSRVPTEGFNK
ncbi:hypothetical protein Hanom_Chr02g00117381 [Helianthus anomalus]